MIYAKDLYSHRFLESTYIGGYKSTIGGYGTSVNAKLYCDIKLLEYN